MGRARRRHGRAVADLVATMDTSRRTDQRVSPSRPLLLPSLLDFSRQVQQQEQRSCGPMELEWGSIAIKHWSVGRCSSCWPKSARPGQMIMRQHSSGSKTPARVARSVSLAAAPTSLPPKLFWLEPGIAVNRAWRILLHWRLLRPGDLRYEGLTNQSPRKREQPGAVPLGCDIPAHFTRRAVS